MPNWFINDEAIYRLFSTYIGQLLLSLLLAWAFRHYSRIYQRHFLLLWSYMWWSYAFHLIGLSWVAILDKKVVDAYLILCIGTFPQISGALLQGVFLVFGTYKLIKDRFQREYLLYAITSAIIVALLSTFLFINDPAFISERYFLRVGLRSAFNGLCFVFCGCTVLLSPVFVRGLGQKILVGAFILFGLAQFQYFLVVILFMFDISWSAPLAYYGIVELVLSAIMGLGMIVWLLEDERQRLQTVNMELDSFLYRTSHDLKAPIASLLGLTNLAKYDVQEPKAKEYFTLIEGRTNKLQDLMSDILTFSQSQKQVIKPEHINFGQLVKEVVEDLYYIDIAKRVSLRYEASEQHQLLTDRQQLRIVLQNLMANSVKYQDFEKPDPYIEIQFMQQKNQVCIELSDNGLGITQEQLPKIFDMFHRAHERSDGSGLGLYIVKQAIKRMNAQISVKSELKVGTTFTICILQKA